MKFEIKKATKSQARLRMAIAGPSGAGKTYTSLALMSVLADKICVLDTERGSASKYADRFNFDVIEMETFSPQAFTEAIQYLDDQGYTGIIIDSLSHAWMGKDGALEQVDQEAKRQQSGNSFTAWKDVTKRQNAMIDAILRSKAHVICTMRSKTEYAMEENERGKKVPVKIGLAPVQRADIEFEFDVVGEMRQDQTFVVTKSRVPALTNLVEKEPGVKLGERLKAWLSDGAPVADAPKVEGPKADEQPKDLWPKDIAVNPRKAEPAKAPAPKPENTFTKEDIKTKGLALRERQKTAGEKVAAEISAACSLGGDVYLHWDKKTPDERNKAMKYLDEVMAKAITEEDERAVAAVAESLGGEVIDGDEFGALQASLNVAEKQVKSAAYAA